MVGRCARKTNPQRGVRGENQGNVRRSYSQADITLGDVQDIKCGHKKKKKKNYETTSIKIEMYFYHMQTFKKKQVTKTWCTVFWPFPKENRIICIWKYPKEYISFIHLLNKYLQRIHTPFFVNFQVPPPHFLSLKKKRPFYNDAAQ